MANATEKPKVGTVTIATVKSRAEARRITTRLESVGIGCLLIDERGAPVGGLGQLRFGGIKVQVHRGDVRRAVELLGEKANNAGAGTSGCDPMRSFWLYPFEIGGWRRTAIEIATIVAFAGMLATIFFY